MRKLKLLPVLAVLATAAIVSPATANPKIPPKYPAKPSEVMRLPKYCWQQYVDGSLGGYQYSIPSESCGYAMNHFCPALVFMIQSQDVSLARNERVGAIQHAVNDIQYTIHDMKPGCFIARDVFQAKQRAAIMSKFVR